MILTWAAGLWLASGTGCGNAPPSGIPDSGHAGKSCPYACIPEDRSERTGGQVIWWVRSNSEFQVICLHGILDTVLWIKWRASSLYIHSFKSWYIGSYHSCCFQRNIYHPLLQSCCKNYSRMSPLRGSEEKAMAEFYFGLDWRKRFLLLKEKVHIYRSHEVTLLNLIIKYQQSFDTDLIRICWHSCTAHTGK